MAPVGDAADFEILEHTADIGLRAQGQTLEELFETAAWGLAAILDRSSSRPNERATGHRVELESGDREGLLVAWMDELLYLLQERDACLAGVIVRTVEPTRLGAEARVVPCARPPEGTDLKAATYHQLAIGRDGEAFRATVYFDV
jgi:SHS2 domain-containing protein